MRNLVLRFWSPQLGTQSTLEQHEFNWEGPGTRGFFPVVNTVGYTTGGWLNPRMRHLGHKGPTLSYTRVLARLHSQLPCGSGVNGKCI